MSVAVLVALGVSTVIYLVMGAWCGRYINGPGDILPLLFGKEARVANHREFAASTVSATISLATVVVAFYELVPTLGLWLLWTAVTTSAGLLVFGLCARKIWEKMKEYDYRPTLHAYLGVEFGSDRLAFVASLFTTVGYLSAFAVEMTVGSRFLGGMIPQIPPIAAVIVIAIVTFSYTSMGGFRVVVVTDRVQMWFIWLLIAALGGYYLLFLSQTGWQNGFKHIPRHLWSLRWDSNLLPFILGIAVMNLLTFVSNMALWQRIAGTQKPDVVVKGMWNSVRGSMLSWSLLVLSAVGAFMCVKPVAGQNLLVTLLLSIPDSAFGRLVVFCATLGLYGALLSTASTQLIAVSHTLYEDVIAPMRGANLHERLGTKREVLWSRCILFFSATGAVGVMELLRHQGFTVADLAFAIYGAALGLVPPVLLTLVVGRDVTRRLSVAATLAVSFGFISCWTAAAYGRAIGDTNIVFLSPIVSSVVAASIMVFGWLLQISMKSPA